MEMAPVLHAGTGIRNVMVLVRPAVITYSPVISCLGMAYLAYAYKCIRNHEIFFCIAAGFSGRRCNNVSIDKFRRGSCLRGSVGICLVHCDTGVDHIDIARPGRPVAVGIVAVKAEAAAVIRRCRIFFRAVVMLVYPDSSYLIC